MRIKEKFNKKLLVEGNDDQHVIWALCEQYKIKEEFDVIDCEGIEKLIDQIPLRFKQSGINAIGLLIDADADLLKRWDKIKRLLQDQGIIVPDKLTENGVIITGLGQISVGIWIMPNNNQNGMIEDFIAFLVPSSDQLLPIIKENLNQIESKKLNKYVPSHKSKAIIHSWLAVQEDPGTPMGLSITKRYLNTDVKNCLSLINWIKELFN